jgi:hypothetical protein
LMLVRYVCSGSEAWVGDALLDWMAAAVGAPEIKVGWHVIVHSGQGLGKDMMIQPVVAGVGEQNVGRVNAKGLNSDFNNYAGQKFIVVSELKQTTSGAATGADQYNTLKELTETANDYIQINPKYGVQFVARNLGAYYVTSNNDVPVKLAEDDRRFMVVDAQRVRPLDVSFYAGLAAWMKGSGGAGTARCAQWLAQRWREVVADDAGGGGRLRALRGNAPMTAGKQAMVRLSRDPVEVWIEEQVAAGGAWPDLMTSEDVARAVGTAAREGVHGFKYVPPPHRLGAMLVKLGGGKVYGGSPVRLKDGSRSRVWATREPERFARLDNGAIAQAYISAAGHSFSDVSEGGGDDGKVVTLASVTDENKCDRFSVDI